MLKQGLVTLGIATAAMTIGVAPAAADGIGDCASFLARDPAAIGPGIDRLGENVSQVATSEPGAIPAALSPLRGQTCS